jgi:hypothetical protein
MYVYATYVPTYVRLSTSVYVGQCGTTSERQPAVVSILCTVVPVPNIC